MTNDLRHLSDELQQGCTSLLSDKLIASQQKCLKEMQQALAAVSKAVDSYYTALEDSAPPQRHDPRYHLMYAARTPLAMMHMSAYLLFAYHDHEMAELTPVQHEQVRQIDQTGRKMVIEIERLWADMLGDQKLPAEKPLMD